MTATVKRMHDDVAALKRMLARVGVTAAQRRHVEADTRLLRECEEAMAKITMQEQHNLAKQAAAEYAVTCQDCEKVWDPVTRGYVLQRKGGNL